MASVSESLGHQSQENQALEAGLVTLSHDQEIVFTKYVRVILPIDGFAFWVKASLLSQSALLNASALNTFAPNERPATITAAAKAVVKCSLHYASNSVQVEDENYTINQVVMTTGQEIQAFNEIGATAIYIGEWDGIRFAFSSRKYLYKQTAGLYHYVGNAIYPAMETQIIDDPAQFNQAQVVSNSLPIWLSLNRLVPMYPSFLVTDNLRPPFCSVHIEGRDTYPLQSAPRFDKRLSHSQLVVDHVRLTLYGLRNNEALDFQDYVFRYMVDSDAMGVFGDMPVIRDEKRAQNELNILAMKKTFELKVNYYQSRAADIARQLILHCCPTFIIDGYVPPVPPPGFEPSLDFSDSRNAVLYYVGA